MSGRSARDKRIREANLQVIEAEIRNYHQTVRDLRELEESIALPGAVGDPAEHVVRTQPGDPTPARAHRMMTSAQLLEIRRRVEAIELKRAKGGRVSKAQREWLEELGGRGWVCSVCEGIDEALDLLREPGYGRRRAG